MRPAHLVAVTILMAALTVGLHPAAAQPKAAADRTGPLDLVRTSVLRVLAIVEAPPRVAASDGRERRADIRRVVRELFDFDEMARLTLARHWRDRPPEEQEEFVRMFTNVLLERSYLTTIENYAGERITFLGESVAGPYAQVRSRITTERGVEISIEYRLKERGARWAVYDVVLDGVSLVSNYRSQFDTIIRTSSFTELLVKLRSKQIAAYAIPRAGRGPRNGTDRAVAGAIFGLYKK
jgi:phospholipid transport system substrate-binding protein